MYRVNLQCNGDLSFNFLTKCYQEISGICFKLLNFNCMGCLSFFANQVVAADLTLTISTARKLFTSVKSSLNILSTDSFLAKT